MDDGPLTVHRHYPLTHHAALVSGRWSKVRQAEGFHNYMTLMQPQSTRPRDRYRKVRGCGPELYPPGWGARGMGSK